MKASSRPTVKKAKKVVSKIKTTKGTRAKPSTQSKTKVKSSKPDKNRKMIKQIKMHQGKKINKLSKSELTRLKNELMEERTRVIRELDNLDDITHTNGDDDIVEVHAYSIHMAENASDIEAVNTALGLRKILVERLDQINNALERLNELQVEKCCLGCIQSEEEI